ncbi:Na+/H+ antiporter NhaA [Pseudolysinimonas kribbensis]
MTSEHERRAIAGDPGDAVAPDPAAVQHTIWARSIASQLGRFLRAESASSGILLAAIVAAVVWASVDLGSYSGVWRLPLSVQVGDVRLGMPLRDWISEGLMTFFFLVVGLEARREFDLGELRDRRQLLMPLAAGIAGMALPVAIFLVANAGGPAAHGWGVAMSTDTALALGLLAILGTRLPERLRGFVVTVFIVDDLVALVVIAVVYSHDIHWIPLVVAVLAWAVIPIMVRLGPNWPALAYVVVGVVCWGGLYYGGVDPVVAGLAIGLTGPAYSPGPDSLETATRLVRRFREQPTSQLARSAGAGLLNTISPNERLQTLYLPVASFVIVPLFALANAGIPIAPAFLATAYTSPITIGIVLGYVVGKPVAVFGISRLIAAVTRGRLRPPVGWAAVAGSGLIAGVGFTVAVLVASLAFRGTELAQAKLGILTAAAVSAVLTWALFRITAALPPQRRAQALLGTVRGLTDLSPDVDPDRDHIRGPDDALVTVVEYGDFECPYCGRAETHVRRLLTDVSVRFVWRHLPLPDVHPHAQLAAQAAEAAGAQGRFWPMHDLLLQHQSALEPDDIRRYAEQLELDLDQFDRDLTRHRYAARIAADVESADVSGVPGTPTFFIDGRRHYGAYDVASLEAGVAAARDAASARQGGAASR